MPKKIKSGNINFLDLGLIPYKEAWDTQQSFRNKRIAGEVCDTILFCEHLPVYTVGKQDCNADWLSSAEYIRSEGIDIVQCDRGGRITYHGPGQLVVYFIVDIRNYSSGVKDFVSRIEDISINLISKFGLSACRNKVHPGVWIGDKKIIAIGFNISHGVSMHGIAVNVAPNMAHYKYIIPCGIRDMGVTSLKCEMGDECPNVDEVKSMMMDSIKKAIRRYTTLKSEARISKF